MFIDAIRPFATAWLSDDPLCALSYSGLGLATRARGQRNLQPLGKGRRFKECGEGSALQDAFCHELTFYCTSLGLAWFACCTRNCCDWALLTSVLANLLEKAKGKSLALGQGRSYTNGRASGQASVSSGVASRGIVMPVISDRVPFGQSSGLVGAGADLRFLSAVTFAKLRVF